MRQVIGNKIRYVLFSAVAAVIGYILFAVWSDFNGFIHALSKIGWAEGAAILGLSLLNYVLRFVRWQWYLSLLGHAIPAPQSALIYFAGFALTTTPGKAGEAVRSLYLQKGFKVPLSHSLAAFFTERFVDLLAVLLLSALVVVAMNRYQGLLIGVALLLGAVLLLVQRPAWLNVATPYLHRLPARLAGVLEKIPHLLSAAGMLLKGRILFGGLLLSLVAWGAEGVAFYLILHFMELPGSVIAGIAVYSIAVLAGALTFLPGGLGGTEAVMILLLVALGCAPADAGAATIVCRLTTLWFAVILGLFAWPAAHRSLSASA
ncbi:MAG: hypothetical protein A3F73_12595 [Gallionellales bacterium RIFCSPLOWO2_12_FULL_59_22]|nr:MAG: hypothetical protein A2Z65_07885 [Gallionellales bacterium RIFCSPLOWO2_02_58_13]OGT13672.1 MAG: hypothetical protein A3F73_12595 [Gallionellales bacterium RIFCSPLOWO2_12_FULL_59_22]